MPINILLTWLCPMSSYIFCCTAWCGSGLFIAHTTSPSIEARQIEPVLAMEQASTMFCQQSHEGVKNYTNYGTSPYVKGRIS